MNKNNQVKAFTLAEIMVWIAIIWFIVIWASNLNFNRLTKNQESEIELVKIINIIEETKNNALIGRWVSTNLETPLNWAVEINSAASGSINSIWTLPSGTWSADRWQTKFPFWISNMRCQTIDWATNDPSTSWVVTITFTWSTSWISWCSNSSYKKLVFDFGQAWKMHEISVNAVTGVIERN